MCNRGKQFTLLIASGFFIFFLIVLAVKGKVLLAVGEKDGKELYSWYCASCHGLEGDGQGFNAEYIDPKPSNHTDADEMSKRTNEKLFDTIYGGGKEVAKSTYMPPWGHTFSEAQIESLVLYLRELCDCEGP